MTRVRFLRTKRFPHPDGPKRHPGEEHLVPGVLAVAWERAGLVEIVPTLEPARVAQPEPEPRPKPKTRPRARARPKKG